jgi:hypothetical protein
VKLPRIKRKFVAIGLATGLAMGAAGIAAAYFSTTGTGHGNASVGAKGSWVISFGAVSYTTDSAIYPGTSETVATTVTHTGHGNAKLNALTATMTKATTPTTIVNPQVVVNSTGAAVAGCQATWFSASITQTGVGSKYGSGASQSETTTITLNTDTVTQDKCATVSPKFTVHAS